MGPTRGTTFDETGPAPRHVLMTTDTVGGVWTYALELSRALARRGIAVSLAAMGGHPDARQRAEALTIPNLEVFPSSYRLEWMDDPWEDLLRAGEWLLELERRLNPDLVHLNGYVHGALNWSKPCVVVGHSCVLSWWRAVLATEAPARWDRYRRAVAKGLREADAVVAPSCAMLSELYRNYGPVPAGRVIYNGRDGRFFVPSVKEDFVLAVGRLWDEAKNIGALDRVAAAIPWPINVAGEQQDPDGRRTRFSGVHPLGRLDTQALSGWYARASIYALPARYEPFGLSVLEAALAGCALVLGDTPSLREVWGDAALFVDPSDYGAIRDGLAKMIAEPGLRDCLARRARTRGEEYTPRRMADSYLALYNELIGARRERRAEPWIPAGGRSAGERIVVPSVEDPVC